MDITDSILSATLNRIAEYRKDIDMERVYHALFALHKLAPLRKLLGLRRHIDESTLSVTISKLAEAGITVDRLILRVLLNEMADVGADFRKLYSFYNQTVRYAWTDDSLAQYFLAESDGLDKFKKGVYKYPEDHPARLMACRVFEQLLPWLTAMGRDYGDGTWNSTIYELQILSVPAYEMAIADESWRLRPGSGDLVDLDHIVIIPQYDYPIALNGSDKKKSDERKSDEKIGEKKSDNIDWTVIIYSHDLPDFHDEGGLAGAMAMKMAQMVFDKWGHHTREPPPEDCTTKEETYLALDALNERCHGNGKENLAIISLINFTAAYRRGVLTSYLQATLRWFTIACDAKLTSKQKTVVNDRLSQRIEMCSSLIELYDYLGKCYSEQSKQSKQTEHTEQMSWVESPLLDLTIPQGIEVAPFRKYSTRNCANYRDILIEMLNGKCVVEKVGVCACRVLSARGHKTDVHTYSASE